MAKSDFCFTFYDGDAARDMMHMSRLERGAYMDIMLQQRKFGPMDEATIRLFLSKDFDACWPALKMVLLQDEAGRYYIEWLENSIDRMTRHAARQSENGKRGGRPKKNQEEPNKSPSENQIKANENPNESQKKPLGNGNGYGYEEDSKEEKGGVGEKEGKEGELLIVPRMLTVWKAQNPAYYIDPDADMAALGAISRHIAKASDTKYQPQADTAKKAILGAWGALVEFISTHTHFRQYSLQQVAKHFQSIHQSMNHEHHPKPTTRATQSAGRDKRGISERRNEVARNW